MKSNVISKYDRSNKLFNIRIRIDEEGFQDEIVLQFKPSDEVLADGTIKVLKDTTGDYVLNTEFGVKASTILAILLQGGYQ